MKIKDGMNILEIGCGGGIFCHRIKTFLPNTIITGIDRDEGHIEYATKKSKELGVDCRFIVGDALKLPFEDNSFDACTSHTVIEHIETTQFLNEQHRILKNGGVISVLSVRTRLNVSPENWRPNDSEESDLLNKAWEKAGNFDKEHGIGSFEMKESDFPIALEKAGFKKINVDFISLVPYAPDNADVNEELAIQQINVNRISTLSSMKKALNIAPDSLTDVEIKRLTELINQRYDERINKYLNGEKLWDIASSSVMAITGYKM
jgi:ubiquinone/menaquinone biosynthesis C-methylase UbiE